MSSPVDIAGYAYAAGMRNPARLAQAVAIAMAESGGDPTKLGDLTLQDSEWGPSVGLWQIRSRKAEKGKGSTRDADRLTDPAFNAKSMMSISGGGSNFDPWSVTHALRDPLGFARYQASMPVATAAAGQTLTTKGAQAAGEAVSDAAGAVLDPIEQLAAVVSDTVQTPARLFKWLSEPGSWVRIGYAYGGMVLVWMGIYIAFRPQLSGLTKTAVQTLMPTGKVAKVAQIAKVGK